jgi:hypothetical protein
LHKPSPKSFFDHGKLAGDAAAPRASETEIALAKIKENGFLSMDSSAR